MKTLSNKFLTIRVSEKGAELCSFFDIMTQTEFIWQAEPAYWKRHSPVLFPIVGSVWDNRYRYQGETYYMSQHGFARDRVFELILEKEDELRYRLVSDERTLEVYPFFFILEIGYRLTGRCLEVSWEVTNPVKEPLFFQIGAHPAFYYLDLQPLEDERGYLGFDRTEGLSYKLISRKGCIDPDVSYPLKLNEKGLLSVTKYTFDNDALILENNQVKKITLYDARETAWLSMHFDAPVVGLWSPPGRDAPFICIEPWYGRCDSVGYTGEFDRKDWIQTLPPGEVFRTSYKIKSEILNIDNL